MSIAVMPFSAKVDLKLIVEGRTFQLGPDRLIFRKARSLPPCEGEIVMTIDNQEQRWKVVLPNGSSIDSAVVMTEMCDR
jgi:hypothetical protein